MDGRRLEAEAEDRHPITMDESGRAGGAPGASARVISGCGFLSHYLPSGDVGWPWMRRGGGGPCRGFAVLLFLGVKKYLISVANFPHHERVSGRERSASIPLHVLHTAPNRRPDIA